MTFTVVRSLALFTTGFALLASSLVAQPRQTRPPASYAQGRPPDQAEGAAILEKLRDLTLAGPYYLEFELHVLPRAGDEQQMNGRWFGTRNASGPLTRIEVTPSSGETEVWLVQSGPHPAVWRADKAGVFAAVEGADATKALGGTNLSAIDLQTPYMYWRDFTYEGLDRFRGRPTWKFLLYPPEEQRAQLGAIGGARIWIDTQYNALTQVQWVDASGKALKTVTILLLKKIGERWIVESFEARDEATRDKTRFVVTAAGLDLKLPDDLFTTTGSGKPADFVPPPGSLTPVP